jgi:hypothetical protein
LLKGINIPRLYGVKVAEESTCMDCFMITLTTPRLRLSGFNASDWPFFLRLRRDTEVMRYMGELLEEPALRTLFESRCADPGVFVLRDASGAAIGDVGLRISSKTRTKRMSDTHSCPKLRGKGTPAKR